MLPRPPGKDANFALTQSLLLSLAALSDSSFLSSFLALICCTTRSGRAELTRHNKQQAAHHQRASLRACASCCGWSRRAWAGCRSPWRSERAAAAIQRTSGWTPGIGQTCHSEFKNKRQAAPVCSIWRAVRGSRRERRRCRSWSLWRSPGWDCIGNPLWSLHWTRCRGSLESLTPQKLPVAQRPKAADRKSLWLSSSSWWD